MCDGNSLPVPAAHGLLQPTARLQLSLVINEIGPYLLYQGTLSWYLTSCREVFASGNESVQLKFLGRTLDRSCDTMISSK